MKLFLLMFTCLASMPAFALHEGYYSDSGRGHITNIGIKVINGSYVIRGCANYGANPRVCNVFQSTIVKGNWGDSEYWSGNGVLESVFYNPSYGKITCSFDFQIRVYEREEGRSLIVQAYTPDQMELQLNGPYCPSRERNYSWRTFYGFRFL